MNHDPGYCAHCFKRIGKRREPCVWCGRDDNLGPRQSSDAPSIGLVPMQIFVPQDVYQTMKARALSLSSKNEANTGISELIVETMRRALAG